VDQPADLSAGGRGAGGEPAIARVLGTAGLAAAVAVALAGCAHDSSRDLDRLESHGVDKLSSAQLERFAHIRIPATATAVRSFYSSSMDTTVYIGLRLPRSAVHTFVRQGRFKRPLRPADRTLFEPVGTELGWRLNDPAKVASR
jgi:hypothetical protein